MKGGLLLNKFFKGIGFYLVIFIIIVAIIDNKNIGRITEIFQTRANDVIRVEENILIPYVDEFIEKIDKQNEKI